MPQRVFEPIYPNPYIAGNPIRNQEMFFGRVDEFRFIARALEDGRKAALIVLFGERRSGKSSILYQILNGRLGEAFLPIFVDMQIMAGIAGDADFFERIIVDACKQLSGNGLSAEPYASQLKEAAATNVFRRFLQEIKSRFPDRAPLLLVDEYENLEARIKEGSLSRHILTFFAGLLETDLVSFVFTGSKNLEAHDEAIWGEELFRKATSRKISFLTKDDTTRLITQPLQNKVDFAPEVVAEIYTLTAGQPFYTQMICQILVYHLNEVQKRNVTPKDLQAVVEGVLENPPPQLLFNWSEHSSERKLALSLLAEFSEAPQTLFSARDLCQGIKRKKLEIDLAPNFFHAELSSLFQDEYVLQKGREYGFRLDLYRRWVRHDHNIWQVKKELGAREIARITKQRHVQKEKKKRALRILERGLEIALVVLVSIILWRYVISPPQSVILEANGGPFWVLVDGETVGTTKGQDDSTRFVFEKEKKLIKRSSYTLQAILLATDESQSETVYIERDDQKVNFTFNEFPVSITTDAARIIARLGGSVAIDTKGQPEPWQHTFSVCAGKYILQVFDPNTDEEKVDTIKVQENMKTIAIDFEQVVVINVHGNASRYLYQYRWTNQQNRKDETKDKLADSALIKLRGCEKGIYHFTFTNLDTGEPVSLKNYHITTDTTIPIKFASNWPPPQPKPHPPKAPQIITFDLQIKTDPSETEVILNGGRRGTTPFREKLKPDIYIIELTKEGYEPVPIRLNLTEDKEFDITLTPQYGHLVIKVNDQHGTALPDAKVYGTISEGEEQFWGQTPRIAIQGVPLRVGHYKIRVECDGFVEERKEVKIDKNKSQEIKIILKER